MSLAAALAVMWDSQLSPIDVRSLTAAQIAGDDTAAGLGLILRGADRMDGVRVSLDAREGGSFGRVESVRPAFGKPSSTPAFAEFFNH